MENEQHIIKIEINDELKAAFSEITGLLSDVLKELRQEKQVLPCDHNFVKMVGAEHVHPTDSDFNRITVRRFHYRKCTKCELEERLP